MTSKLFSTPQAVRVDSTGTPYPSAKAYFYLSGTLTATDTYQDGLLGTAHANPVVADSAGQFPAIYLDPDINYRCILKESDDTTIDDVDPVSKPMIAGDVVIADVGGYFTGTDTESVLQEVGANYAKKSSTNTWTGNQTFSSAELVMADNVIRRPELTDFAITHQTVTSSGGTLTLDFAVANSFYHLLTANVTTFNLNNPPGTGNYGQCTLFIKQDGGGGAYTMDFANENVVWAGGSAPTISTANNALDVATFMTFDQGTTWYGNISQAYAAP